LQKDGSAISKNEIRQNYIDCPRLKKKKYLVVVTLRLSLKQISLRQILGMDFWEFQIPPCFSDGTWSLAAV